MNKVNRLKVVHNVVDPRLTTQLAAKFFGISDRHCRRLLQRYRADGPLDMAEHRHDKPSNYPLPGGLTERAIQAICLQCADFGPTLACSGYGSTSEVKDKFHQLSNDYQAIPGVATRSNITTYSLYSRI
ncbi:helix-turn-helix domain-containing protein [Erwinia sp. S63]|uniref:helix-turn-helix domain-containing protein n=1 Tax=Erwinia sp. S63 TaxID=2769341 RepID=UPI001909F60E|nr:helix-turn-helix domain-containing protein [Erwinia sp. S63]MBK0097474.1 helix-turn-helix domain-containing protein [Erwinia sp. S63]